MEGYLGETVLTSLADTPFEKYRPEDWALYFIGSYGQIDGDHHKLWVMDQVARILLGTPMIVKLARWQNGTTEYRCSTGEPTEQYRGWVEAMKGKVVDPETGETEYYYDPGTPP